MSTFGKFNILTINKFFNLCKIIKIVRYNNVMSMSLNYNRIISTQINSNYLINAKRDYCTKKSTTDEFREREENLEKEFNLKINLNNENQNSNEKIKQIKENILKESLKYVPEYGWTKTALAKGAENVGYHGISHGIFQDGAIELVHYFYQDCNKKLVVIMKKMIEENQKNTSKENTMKPIEFVREVIKIRLQMLEPYLNNWPQAMALMSLPQNASKSLANILTLADDICYLSGDRSVDFGWYVRRVGIAGIYKMTELFMLQDKSPGFSNTWQFLQHRIDDGLYIHQYINFSDDTTKNLQNVLGTAFTTARNMLGLNNYR